MDETRECLRCGKTKDLTEFAQHPSTYDTHERLCSACKSERRSQSNSFPRTANGGIIYPSWYNKETEHIAYLINLARNPDAYKAKSRSYWVNHPEKRKEYQRRAVLRAREKRAQERATFMRERGIVVGVNKLCRGCDTVKDLTEYNVSADARDGRKTRCRQCQKDHHYKVRETRLPQMRAYNADHPKPYVPREGGPRGPYGPRKNRAGGNVTRSEPLNP